MVDATSTNGTGTGRDAAQAAVSVTLEQLKDGSVSLERLEEAFGPSSLGIIVVTGLPAEFAELRAKVLSYSSYLANLPAEELQKIEVPKSNYNVGWSCGRETLSDGRYDTLKGSFYAAPIHNAELEAKAAKLYPHVPEFTTPNVWPESLPEFERLFEKLCALIVDVAAFVARSCDRYGAARLDGYRDGCLERIVRSSVATKARLLHYFPAPPVENGVDDGGDGGDVANGDQHEDAWCASHRDLGALTGLTSQMFVYEEEARRGVEAASFPPLPELDAHPDPEAGLWIQDRAGRATQVHIPRDALAFQTGQALESITRGAFRAVPHYVRGAAAGVGPGIARNSLAVFTQPNLWDVVDDVTGKDFADLGQFTLRSTV